MGLEHALFEAKVVHARHRPRENAFCYGVFNLSLPISAIKDLKQLAVLSYNRFNLFGFYDRDHGRKDGSSLEDWARGILQQWNVTAADGDIVLVTMPRIIGYVFNPVSFWFCLDQQGALRAVISEVNNTFGDSHSYISFHDDQRPIMQDDILKADKVLHVSPFIKVEGFYQFRFAYKPEKLGVWIDLTDTDGLLISTSIVGARKPLTTGNLLLSFIKYPLVTVKVITLIHYQAVKLFLKGVRYCPRPKPPSTEVSR